MKRTKRPLAFKNEDAERDFWANHDLAEAFDLKKGKMENRDKLPSAIVPVTVRLPTQLTDFLKARARQMGMGYQNLIKSWLWERMGQENLKKGVIPG